MRTGTDNNRCRSVLITTKEIDICNNVGICLPWKSDAICFKFNMNMPREVFLWDNIGTLSDPENIVTLVIDGEGTDYSFIAEMKHLRQLYIYNSPSLSDISFVKNLQELNQILINESRISSLGELIALVNKKQAIEQKETDIWKKLPYSIHEIFINSAMEPDGIDDLLCSGMHLEEIIINGKRRRKSHF